MPPGFRYIRPRQYQTCHRGVEVVTTQLVSGKRWTWGTLKSRISCFGVPNDRPRAAAESGTVSGLACKEPEVFGLERLDTIMIAVILLERLFWNEAEDEWSG